MDFLIGVGLLVIAGLAYRLALPHEDGQVRNFLRNEQAQTYYAVAVICLTGLAVVYVITGARALFG